MREIGRAHKPRRSKIHLWSVSYSPTTQLARSQRVGHGRRREDGDRRASASALDEGGKIAHVKSDIESDEV
eukprot:1407195-Rhodomonas_salina.2